MAPSLLPVLIWLAAAPLEVSVDFASQRWISGSLPILYPPLARQAGISGPVEVKVLVGVDGRVDSIEGISGHPLLLAHVRRHLAESQFRPLRIRQRPATFAFRYKVNFELLGATSALPRPVCRWPGDDPGRALQCLESLARKTSAESLLLADVLDYLGRSEDAFLALERALPESQELYLERAAMLGRWEQARSRLRELGLIPLPDVLERGR